MSRSAAHYKPVTRRDLSPRQREVLELIAKGKTNGEIAETLGITLDGAKWHVSEILTKLDVDSREDAAEWWAARRGIGARLANLARAFAPLAQWKVAAPVVGVLGVGAAAAVMMLSGGNDTKTEDSPVPACSAGDVMLETVETRGPNGEVVFALTGRSARACRFEGSAGISISIAADLTTSGASPSWETPVQQVVDETRTRIAYATWTSNCLGGAPKYANSWLRSLNAGDSYTAYATTFVVNHPECGADGRTELVIAPPDPLSSFMPDLGPDPQDWVYCYPSDPTELAKWKSQCEQADRLQQVLNTLVPFDRTADAFVRFAAPTDYVCPTAGFSTLCGGVPVGATRQGIPLLLHGSEEDFVSVDQLRDRLQEQISSAESRASTIGCPVSGDCTKTFIVGFAVDRQPAAFYLVFETTSGDVHLVGAGISGDNALEIRRGGTTFTQLGETLFTPVIPPY